MNNLFVPYELALELKNKGFDEECLGVFELIHVDDTIPRFRYNFYIGGAETKREGLWYNHNSLNRDWKWSAPMYQQVIDWFREKHKLHIKITRDGGWWLVTTHDLSDEDNSSPESKNNTKTYIPQRNYYQALNKAIEESLKLI